MTQPLAPASDYQHYQRSAALSTLPSWQLPDITEPSGPQRGHVWHGQDVYPELARSRDITGDAAVLQRRALIVCNPRLTPTVAGPRSVRTSFQSPQPGSIAAVMAYSRRIARGSKSGLAPSAARIISLSMQMTYPRTLVRWSL
jgi:hypothetical protein